MAGLRKDAIPSLGTANFGRKTAGSRKDALPSFCSTMFLRQPAITANIPLPPAMMTNVAPPRSGPSGMLRVIQTAGAAPLPLSGMRNDALPSFGLTNVVRQMASTRQVTFLKFGIANFMQTSFTVNIAPPTNHVVPPPSVTTSLVKTACAAPPPPGTTIMNVDPHQSGLTHVVQMTATMNFADLLSGTTKLVMTDNSMMHPDSDTLPIGKSNACRKRRRANHNRNVKAHKSGVAVRRRLRRKVQQQTKMTHRQTIQNGD
jgi:hypothetical protein